MLRILCWRWYSSVCVTSSQTKTLCHTATVILTRNFNSHNVISNCHASFDKGALTSGSTLDSFIHLLFTSLHITNCPWLESLELVATIWPHVVTPHVYVPFSHETAMQWLTVLSQIRHSSMRVYSLTHRKHCGHERGVYGGNFVGK